MNSGKQRRIGSVLGYVYTVIHSITALIYIPLLINGIGDGEYGLYQIMGSVIAYFSVMETPLSSSILRYYSKYKEQNDTLNMENTLALGRRVFRILSMLFLIAIVPCILIINYVYSKSLSPAEIEEADLMFVLMIINLVISANNYVYLASINAHERFIFTKLSSIVIAVIQPFCIIVVIHQFPMALSIVAIQVILNLLLSLIRWRYALSLGVRIVFHGRDMVLLKNIFNLSLSVLFTALADQIFWRADQLILGAFYGTEVVAVYSVGSQINTVYISVGVVISGIVLPFVTRINNKDDSGVELFSLFKRIGRYQTYITTLILGGVILYGKEFILIISSEKYLDAYQVALLLMIPYTVDLIQNSGNVILQVKDKFHYRAFVQFFMAILNIVLTIILVKYIGMIGAAIATTVSILFGSLLLMNIVYYKQLGFNILLFWKNIIPIIFSCFVSLFIGGLIKCIYIHNSVISFVVHGFLYLVVFTVSTWFISMNTEEKQKLGNIIMRGMRLK